MIPFDLAEPKSFAEAIKLLDPDDPTIRPLGGGTALMLMMKAGVFQPAKLISLRKIEKKYSAITVASGGLTLGALTTLADLERSDAVSQQLPMLKSALRTLSNIRVRNVATVGGALAHGDPHMDLPPVLIALGATVTIVGPNGERKIPLEELFAGYYETTLEKNELIADVFVPAQGARKAHYAKVTTGSADDWPALGVAVAFEAEGRTIQSARVVVSAATEKAARMTSAEDALNGKTIDDKILAAAGDAAAAEADVLPDVRGSAPYKRELIRVYVRRAIQAALDGKGAH